jgi:hypothetical protein
MEDEEEPEGEDSAEFDHSPELDRTDSHQY